MKIPVQTTSERKLQGLLFILAVASFVIIGKGIYNQNHQIDQDFLLVPLLFGIYSFIFISLGWNSLKGGSLLLNWFFLFISPSIAENKKPESPAASPAGRKINSHLILGIAATLTGVVFLIALLSSITR